MQIKCHQGASFSHLSKGEWKPPEPFVRADGHEGRPYRSCDYCGSIHPEDLIAAVKAGAELHGADWKYGWPHKFYVEKIPNPGKGEPVSYSSSSGPFTEAERAEWDAKNKGKRVDWSSEKVGDITRWTGRVFEPAREFVHAKWYNTHLNDVEEPLFTELVGLLEKHTGIHFEKVDGRLKYSAPSPGYQR